jgi:hypothetical protein
MRRYEFSPYYPPRARWYSPLFRISDTFRRITCLDRIHLPDAMSWGPFLAALLIPGLAFRLRRERLIAYAIMGAYLLLAAVFVIWLGYSVANIAFGLMLSLHATSILFLCNPWMARMRFIFRLLFGVAVLVVLGGLVYAPVRGQIQNHCLMPLRVRQEVVVIQTFCRANLVQRGDWIAYRVEGDRLEGAIVQAGLGLRPVTGLPGDEIAFSPDACLVNGAATPRLQGMPDHGGFVVPENHWFVWPEHDITLRGRAAQATADAALLSMSDVAQEQFVGRPFKRWFWRRQDLQ